MNKKPERPFLGLDTTYADQRKDRMGDAIGDYLNDEEVDAAQAYQEMLSETQEWVKYHHTQWKKGKDLLELMLGHKQSPPLD